MVGVTDTEDRSGGGAGLSGLPAVALRLISPGAIALAAGLTSLLIGITQLAAPGVFRGVLGYNLGYDDGVYIGAPTRLVHGAIPYRDFVIVYPPGHVYLMAPIALLGRLAGTAASLEAARVVTVLVVAANALLAGLVVRSAGRLAVAIAGFAVALWPLSVSVDRTSELEPYLVLFCLLGVLVLFRGGRLATGRRLVVGGALLGFACAVKVWAVLPVVALVLVLVCLRRWGRELRSVVAGVVAGGVLPCLPFLALAPEGFVHDVVTAQLGRKNSFAGTTASLGDRLLLVSGFGGRGGITTSAVLPAILLAVLCALVAVAHGLDRAQRSALEWFVLAAAIVANLGMFATSEFYDHYAYFPAVFVALLAGVALARAVPYVLARVPEVEPEVRAGAISTAATAALVALVAGLVHDIGYGRTYLSEVSDPAGPIRRAVPAGACVVSDYPVDLLLAGRYVADRAGCPTVVDPFGLFLADDDGNQPHPAPPFQPAFVDEWRRWLGRADYVIVRIPYSDFMPWPQEQIAWFAGRFRLVAHDQAVYPTAFLDARKDMYIYRNAERVPVRSPADSTADVQRGLDVQSAGRTAEAEADYRLALAEDPSNRVAAYDLGVIAQQQGRAADAQRWYSQALHIDPGYVPALNNLAILLTPTAPDQAISLYRTLVTQRPDDAQVHLRLGLLLEQQGRQADGAAEIATARRLDPSIPAPH